jgi:LuxR family maltose regulon positive regulatory protein
VGGPNVTPVKDPPITDLAMPLLSTKYAAPPRPRRGFVDRQALSDAITSARGVLLVCAPPGYGKTTLVAGWAARPSVSCAWLTLDEADNDPVTFGAYLLAAVREAVPGAAPDIAPPASPAALAPLINALAAHRAECSIVLDDYHAITTRGAHDMTVFLARHLPPNVRLIVTTRHDPPLPLARLRARGLLTEIRARDLRFSADDAARFLAGAMGLDVSRSAVERLTERTEGWVAGLQLAGLSLRGAPDPEAFVDAFGATDRYLFDYLFDETLATQPPLISSFLEATSILGRLSGELCDAVTGRSDGAAMLEALAGANLFLSPLDDRGEWFRYHRLFADLVSSGLDDARRRTLHARAADWFAAHDLPGEAIRHAFAAGDMSGAALLVERTAERTLARGETATLLGWCAALPPDILEGHPDLVVARAWATFMSGDIAGAERALGSAPAAIGAGTRPSARRVCLEAWFANRHDLPEAEALARAAIDLTPEEDPVFRSLAYTTLGESIVGRDAGGGVQAFEEAHRLAMRAGRSALLAGTIYSLANTWTIAGRRDEAEAVCRRTIEEVTGAGAGMPAWLGMIHLPLGTALFEADLLVQARQHIATGQELCERGHLRVTMLGASEWQEVLALHLLGETDQAWRRIESVSREAARVGIVRVVMSMASAAAELLLLEGDPAGARSRLDAGPAVHADVLGTIRDRTRQTRSRVLVAQGRNDEALAILVPLAEEQRAGGRLGRLITTLATLAVARERSRSRSAALAALSEAVSLGAAGGYRRALVDGVLPVTDLLPRVRHVAPAFVDGLLALHGDRPGAANGPDPEPSRSPDRARASLVEPISVRELEVLRLVAAGLSNEEIGRAIFVSTGTAKWHVHNLLGKVGARNRVGLVAEARAIGLL